MNNEMLGKKILWIAVLAAVLVGCLAMNFGPGWLGWQASVPCLCATLVYILTVTAFLVMTCNYRPFARFSLILSLVTLQAGHLLQQVAKPQWAICQSRRFSGRMLTSLTIRTADSYLQALRTLWAVWKQLTVLLQAKPLPLVAVAL